jgi:hypothetical protein
MPVSFSIRRSRYQSLTDITIVSVVSEGGSGSQRIEIRVEKRHSDVAGLLGDIVGGLCLVCVLDVGRC